MPLAREVTTGNWAKEVKIDNATPMNVDEWDVEPGRVGKAARSTFPPPSIMHCEYAGVSAKAMRREDDRGGKQSGGSR